MLLRISRFLITFAAVSLVTNAAAGSLNNEDYMRGYDGAMTCAALAYAHTAIPGAENRIWANRGYVFAMTAGEFYQKAQGVRLRRSELVRIRDEYYANLTLLTNDQITLVKESCEARYREIDEFCADPRNGGCTIFGSKARSIADDPSGAPAGGRTGIKKSKPVEISFEFEALLGQSMESCPMGWRSSAVEARLICKSHRGTFMRRTVRNLELHLEDARVVRMVVTLWRRDNANRWLATLKQTYGEPFMSNPPMSRHIWGRSLPLGETIFIETERNTITGWIKSPQ